MAGYSAGGDPYWNNVVALLHGDGTDGSTTFTDEKGHTFTAGGNAQLDTAIKAFGTASILFDNVNDYITSADSTDWEFGSGDFTVEMWFYPNSWNLGAYQSLLAKWSGGGADSSYFFYVHGDNKMGLTWTTDGTTAVDREVSGSSLSAAQQIHFAWSRNGTTLRMFRNGTQMGADQTLSGTIWPGSDPIYLGTLAGTLYDVNGLLDEIRITKGVGRYTSNFSVQMAAWPNY